MRAPSGCENFRQLSASAGMSHGPQLYPIIRLDPAQNHIRSLSNSISSALAAAIKGRCTLVFRHILHLRIRRRAPMFLTGDNITGL